MCCDERDESPLWATYRSPKLITRAHSILSTSHLRTRLCSILRIALQPETIACQKNLRGQESPHQTKSSRIAAVTILRVIRSLQTLQCSKLCRNPTAQKANPQASFSIPCRCKHLCQAWPGLCPIWRAQLKAMQGCHGLPERKVFQKSRLHCAMLLPEGPPHGLRQQLQSP
jgi:hypothetical protein